MRDIIELEKVLEQEEDFIFHFRLKKDFYYSFSLVLDAFKQATAVMSIKVRLNETKILRAREENEEANRRRLNGIKEQIRAKYQEAFKIQKNVFKAFKEVRKEKEFYWYKWLIASVEREVLTKEELEILKLFNSGIKRPAIAKRRHLSYNFVSNVIKKNIKEQGLE